MKWGWVKAFPKFALVFIVFVVSTGLFGFWWFFLRPRPHSVSGQPQKVIVDVEKIRSRIDWSLLVGRDLYDVETGELLRKNWLNGDTPSQVFYDATSGKILGQYEKGFARYALDGKKETEFFQKSGMLFSTDNKSVTYAKEKDLWQADVDWIGFKLVNDHKITSLGTFNDLYFSQNVLLAGSKIFIVRNQNQLLRVNLESGEVKPIKIPLQDLKRGRSPNGQTYVGDMPAKQGRMVFAYDVETDTAKTFEIGRNAAGGYTWLDNDRCIFLVSGKAIGLLDRRKDALEEITTLPFRCTQLGDISPSGKYAFCADQRNGLLVDLDKKSASPITGGAGIAWVGNDTFAFSRDVQDSQLRGTWLQTVGEGERRVSPEPYLVGKGGGFIMPLPSAGLVVFATKGGIVKMKPDGSDSTELVKLPGIPSSVLAIQKRE